MPGRQALLTADYISAPLHSRPVKRPITRVVPVTEPTRPVVATTKLLAVPDLEFTMVKSGASDAHRLINEFGPPLGTQVEVEVQAYAEYADNKFPLIDSPEPTLMAAEEVPSAIKSVDLQALVQSVPRAPEARISAEILKGSSALEERHSGRQEPMAEPATSDLLRTSELDKRNLVLTYTSVPVLVTVPTTVQEAEAVTFPADPLPAAATPSGSEFANDPQLDMAVAIYETNPPTPWKQRSVGEVMLGQDCSVRLSNCITSNPEFFAEWTIGKVLANRSSFAAALVDVRNLGRKTATEVLDALEAFAHDPKITEGGLEVREHEPVPADPLAALDQAKLDTSIRLVLRSRHISVRLANLLAGGAVDDLTVRDFILHPDHLRARMMGCKNAGRKTVTEALALLSAHVETLWAPDTGANDGQAEDELPEGFTTREWIQREMSALPANRVEVLHNRYGLDGQHPTTLQEIAERVHVTRERVRQIEAAAIRCLRAAVRSRAAFARHLTETKDSQLAVLFEPLSMIPEGEVSERFRLLDPWVLLAIDIVFEDGRNGYLNANAHRTAAGWFKSSEEAEERQELDQSMRDLVGTYRMPMPLDTIAAIAPSVTAFLPAQGDNWTLRDGYVFTEYVGSKARRTGRMHAIARRIATSGIFDIGTLILEYRFEFPEDECGSRMFEMQANEAPHLFVPLFDGIWLCLDHNSRQVDRLSAPPFELRQVNEQHFAAGSLGDFLIRRLAQLGPQRAIDLRRTVTGGAPGSFSESSVGAVLISNPCFRRAAPGIFGLYGDAPGASSDIDAHLLDDRHCRFYCHARHSGSPQGYYPLWGAAYEMRLAAWAQRHAPDDLYRSLLSVIEPASWPAPSQTIAEFETLRASHGQWQIGAARRLELGHRFLDSGQFLSTLTHLIVFGWISWVGVNRATGSKPDAHDAADVLAFFVMTGLVKSGSDWQAPHQPTGLAKRLFLEAKLERHLHGDASSGDRDMFGRLRDTLYEVPPTASRGWVNVDDFTTAMIAWKTDGIWMGKAFGGSQHRKPSMNAEGSFASDDWDAVFG